MNNVCIYPLYTIMGKIYKYLDMNIFVNFLLYLIVFSILYVIMEEEPKIFLNLLQLPYNNINIMLLYFMLPIYI